MFTILVGTVWAYNCIVQRKFIFRRTILDWPLVIYLSIYLLSTLFSIDPRTSWLGYYSRFNGGLISQICYALLYWTYVSNLNKKQSLSTMYFVLTSTTIASILAVFEHFGIFSTCGLMGFGWKESCWVQDVQARVFSTLGQPNWLAALLVILIPFTWRKSFKYYLLSILFFVTLLFTKSRSGLLAFGIEAIIFWGFMFKKHVKEFLILFVISVILYFIFSSPLTINPQPLTISNAPALESGGTESSTIRKFVWLGALKVFIHYPILGTGPETFAFSYPMFKPVEHNITSEWDFIYNKAHNEYLNYLANTGFLGIISYLMIIYFSILQIYKSKNYAFFAGYISILVTNFFGFSIVPVSLLFFLFPAISLVQDTEYKIHLDKTKLKIFEKLAILGVLLTTYYILHTIYSYWKADYYYAKSDVNNALLISPNEAIYISKLALINSDVETASKALKLSPLNQNIRKVLISNLVKSADKIPNNLLVAEDIIKEGINISPNDPKLYYQLGMLQLKIDKNDDAILNLQKSIELKPNYKEGHFALGITYKALNEFDKARTEFEYILKKIDPSDELTKKYLEELK